MDSITRYNDYLNQETTGEEFKTFLEGKTVEEAGGCWSAETDLDWLINPGDDVGEESGVQRPAHGVPHRRRLARAQLRHARGVRGGGEAVRAPRHKGTSEAGHVGLEQVADVVQFCNRDCSITISIEAIRVQRFCAHRIR